MPHAGKEISPPFLAQRLRAGVQNTMHAMLMPCRRYDILTGVSRLCTQVTHVHAQVVEHGLGHLPFTEKCVVTATGHLWGSFRAPD